MSTGQKWAFALIGAGVIAGFVFVALTLLDGCASPQVAAVQTQYTVEESAHSTELGKCLADVKADGGRLSDFCSHCWDPINGKYHLDAGVECK